MPSWPRRNATQIRKVTLTSAQILALTTTAVEIVPAPGAGVFILPISIAARHIFNTAAYAAGSTIYLYVGDPANDYKRAAIQTDILGAPANSMQIGPSVLFGPYLGSTPAMTNVALHLKVPGAAFTTGDGTLDVYIAYDVWLL